ncbi:MAG: CPBP family intramembrane glutamic endopeptidase, partial [Trueperaceae bacterium]|nr:CPBP family intramembrane glutamic endopeptidase [Trueperaceae bacterium]
AAALAVATSAGEEILFRGMLLPTLGLVPQALLFGLLHPAGRRGWSYPVFTALAGLAFGALVEASGRLTPAVLAHGVVNAAGLLRGARAARRARRHPGDVGR